MFTLQASKSEELRKRRQKSARRKIRGTEERPRLCVYRSNNHLYVQIIDDIKMHTMAATGTLSPGLKDDVVRNNIAAAQIVGTKIARICSDQGIRKVVFDRAGSPYSGRIKAL